jgi:hypothetical protein
MDKGTWREDPQIKDIMSGYSWCAFNDTIFSCSGAGYLLSYSSCDVVPFNHSVSSRSCNMLHNRRNCTAVQISRDQMWIVGGGIDNFTRFNSEIYDDTTNTCIEGPLLPFDAWDTKGLYVLD